MRGHEKLDIAALLSVAKSTVEDWAYRYRDGGIEALKPKPRDGRKPRLGNQASQRLPSMPEFREDLASAGIEGEDAPGRKVVLHSLRDSLCTMMAASGVPMAYSQRILRHRDIKLTAEVYCDEGLLSLAAAMNSLPTLTIPAPLALPSGPTAATA